MSRTHDEILNSLPEERRQKIQARAAEIMEELTLRELRQALGLSQKELAELMRVSQPAVSKQERRTDMQLSTLAGVIHAMGGTLEITAHFPDRGAVRLTRGM